MKKLRWALVAMMMVNGLAFAADDAAKPPAPPPNSSDAFNPARLPALLKWSNTLIAKLEESSGMVRSDEAKKVFAEAIAAANEFHAGLEQLSAAAQAAKDDEVRRLTAQLREKFSELQQYNNILGTWMELDQAKTQQAERGKDNPDLNACYQRIIDLLNKRLDLQNQVGAVNREIRKERQALQQFIQSAPDNAPAAEPPKPAPNATTKPNDAP
jgi:hypothetical protein